MNFSVQQSKRNFFDRSSVMDAIGRGRVKALNRQGALVRKIMRQSMRRKKGPAPAGEPPNAHQGNIRDLTFYAYDPANGSCVVGPAKLAGGKAPEVQDKGGQVPVLGVFRRDGSFVPLYLMSSAGRTGALATGRIVTVMCKVEPRPFSVPALQKSKAYLAPSWRGVVTK